MHGIASASVLIAVFAVIALAGLYIAVRIYLAGGPRWKTAPHPVAEYQAAEHPVAEYPANEHPVSEHPVGERIALARAEQEDS
jgi:hypothetical protein